MTGHAAPAPPAPGRMTADEYLAWALDRPDGGRFELIDGEVAAMSPERVSHVRVKARVWRALDAALAAAALPCEAFADGVAVRIDEGNVVEPDALVRCGEPLDDAATELNDPVIVVEVLSPGTRSVDTGAKLDGYFDLASVRHYLIVHPTKRTVIHHARDGAGRIQTAIHRDRGVLALDPPGLAVDVAAFFG